MARERKRERMNKEEAEADGENTATHPKMTLSNGRGGGRNVELLQEVLEAPQGPVALLKASRRGLLPPNTRHAGDGPG